MRSHLVAVVAYDDLCTFEFACAVEIFSVRWPGIDVPWYRVRGGGVVVGRGSVWGGGGGGGEKERARRGVLAHKRAKQSFGLAG